MKKEIAIELKERAEITAKKWGEKREYNPMGEKYFVHEIIPLSEYVACVVYMKSTGKKAAELFIYIKNWWWDFFPTDSHLLGIRYFERIKQQIEVENFKVNFKKKEGES